MAAARRPTAGSKRKGAGLDQPALKRGAQSGCRKRFCTAGGSDFGCDAAGDADGGGGRLRRVSRGRNSVRQLRGSVHEIAAIRFIARFVPVSGRFVCAAIVPDMISVLISVLMGDSPGVQTILAMTCMSVMPAASQQGVHQDREPAAGDDQS